MGQKKKKKKSKQNITIRPFACAEEGGDVEDEDEEGGDEQVEQKGRGDVEHILVSLRPCSVPACNASPPPDLVPTPPATTPPTHPISYPYPPTPQLESLFLVAR